MKNKDKPIQRTIFDVVQRIGAPPHVPDTGWYECDLLNGWLGNVDNPPQYALRADGTVVMQGEVYYGFWGMPIFQLPVGYRPEIDMHCSVFARPITFTGTGVATALLGISPNGWVYVDSPHAEGHSVINLSTAWFRSFEWTSEEDDETLDVVPHMITRGQQGHGWLEMIDHYARGNIYADPDLSIVGSVVELPLLDAIHNNVVCLFAWQDENFTTSVRLLNVELLDDDGTIMTWTELAENLWISTAPETGVMPYWRLTPDLFPFDWQGYYSHHDEDDIPAYNDFNGYLSGDLVLSGSTAYWRLTFNTPPAAGSSYQAMMVRGVLEAGATGAVHTGSAGSVSETITVAQGNSVVLSVITTVAAAKTPFYGEVDYFARNNWWSTGPDPNISTGYADAGTISGGWSFVSPTAYILQTVVLPGQFTTPRGNTVNEYY